MEGSEIIKDQPSYITLIEANEYMYVNVSVTGWTDVPLPTDDEKENYILSAYQEIDPDSIETEAEGKRQQLTLLSVIFMDKEDFYRNKSLQATGVQEFTNSKLKMKFNGGISSVGQGGDGGNDGGNDVIDL